MNMPGFTAEASLEKLKIVGVFIAGLAILFTCIVVAAGVEAARVFR
jgi:hypothetical protein